MSKLTEALDVIEEVGKTGNEAGSAEVPGYVTMPRKLTAENGAKALLIGEFFEETYMENPEYCGCGECDYCHDNPPDTGETIKVRLPVSWTTIKAIYDMAVKNLAT